MLDEVIPWIEQAIGRRSDLSAAVEQASSSSVECRRTQRPPCGGERVGAAAASALIAWRVSVAEQAHDGVGHELGVGTRQHDAGRAVFDDRATAPSGNVTTGQPVIRLR